MVPRENWKRHDSPPGQVSVREQRGWRQRDEEGGASDSSAPLRCQGRRASPGCSSMFSPPPSAFVFLSPCVLLLHPPDASAHENEREKKEGGEGGRRGGQGAWGSGGDEESGGRQRAEERARPPLPRRVREPCDTPCALRVCSLVHAIRGGRQKRVWAASCFQSACRGLLQETREERGTREDEETRSNSVQGEAIERHDAQELEYV